MSDLILLNQKPATPDGPAPAKEPKPSLWVRIRRWVRRWMILHWNIGLHPNPLQRFPRNQPCWCGSGRKAKACCLPKTPQYVPEREAQFLHNYMIHVELAQPGSTGIPRSRRR
jgi:uncharacterized protein YecA (UPF0149 family)